MDDHPVIVARWEHGLRRTRASWRRFFAAHPAFGTRPEPLRPYLAPYLAGRTTVRLLDAGSGPVSFLGQTWPGVAVTLTACDLLADEYRQWCAEAGVTQLVPVVKADLRALPWPDGSFDLVHCSNALDHTVNPWRAIRELVRVCAPDGWVYLRHARNVGKINTYRGQHQWNIHELPDGDSVYWVKDPPLRFLLSECVPGFQTEARLDDPTAEKRHGVGHPYVVSVYHKAAACSA